MATLSHDRLLQLQQAIMRSRLDDRRDALLTSIDRRVVAQLPKVACADAQILGDLDYLNNLGAIDDGTYPLEAWLKNAVTLASPRQEADVFHDILFSVYGEGSRNHVLVVSGGKCDGTQVHLREGTEILVGRGHRARLAFNHDPTISSSHAKLWVRDHALRVKDLDSLNGVYVNDSRVSEARLSVGDRIRCGETVLVVTEIKTPVTVPLRIESVPLLQFAI